MTQSDATDFERYRKLISRLACRPVAAVVSSADGDVVWFGCAGPGDGLTPEQAAALSKFMFSRRDEFEQHAATIRARQGNTDVVATMIPTVSGEFGGLLIALAPVDNDNDSIEPLIHAVGTTHDFLVRELGLAGEIDVVAQELSDRYEELNLLYSTEECLQYFDDSEAGIRQLVEKTAMHLEVGAVCFRLPVKHLSIDNVRNEQIDQGRLKSMAEHVAEVAAETGQPVIANDSRDSDGGQLYSKLQHKCLAIPFFSSRGNVEGVFCAFDTPDRNNFSNSDRNIMEVMARRIRWILESNRDSLTGLLARKAFERRMNTALTLSRSTGVTSSLLYLNIDRLHVINDMRGPHAGDAAICVIASKLNELSESEFAVARLNGDEFGVLITDCELDRAKSVADRICSDVAAIDFDWEGETYDLSISIGIGLLTQATQHAEEPMSAAEIACAEAKEAGGGRSRALRQHDTVLVMRQKQMQWIGKVSAALRESRFELHAQTIQPLRSGDTRVHHELLIRLRGEEGELIGPDQFLPSAERYSLMPDIDRWVVDHAFGVLSTYWHDLDPEVRAEELTNTSWAINLSGQSMGDVRMLKYITERLQHYALPAQIICFEVTESAAVSNISDARRLIAALRARGCKFSLDDFGTGVSSFAYLKNLPVDYLKIDGSFVRPILEDVAADAVVAAIAQIAKALDLISIAEFVEDVAVADRLRELGIDFGQGYAYSRPIKLQTVLQKLEQSRTEAVA